MPDAAELKRTLLAVFPNSPFSKGTPVAEHECDECLEIRKAFADQSPFGLPAPVLEYHHDSLPMMSPAAFHHFLPAYLIYAIDNPDSLVAQSAWFSLSPTQLDEHHIARRDLFSVAQRAAVREVVEFLIALDDAPETITGERQRAREFWRAA